MRQPIATSVLAVALLAAVALAADRAALPPTAQPFLIAPALQIHPLFDGRGGHQEA